jgi:hypothetical protein
MFEAVKNTSKLTFNLEPGAEMDFVQRRSDFQGVTLKAMVEIQSNDLRIPPNFKAMGTIFDLHALDLKYKRNYILAMFFPENKTYDVTGLTNGLYKEVLTILETELNFTTRQYKRQDGAWGLVTVDTSTGTLLSTVWSGFSLIFVICYSPI